MDPRKVYAGDAENWKSSHLGQITRSTDPNIYEQTSLAKDIHILVSMSRQILDLQVLHGLDRVDEWEPRDLHDRACGSWVGSVRRIGSCATYHNDRYSIYDDVRSI